MCLRQVGVDDINALCPLEYVMSLYRSGPSGLTPPTGGQDWIGGGFLRQVSLRTKRPRHFAFDILARMFVVGINKLTPGTGLKCFRNSSQAVTLEALATICLMTEFVFIELR